MQVRLASAPIRGRVFQTYLVPSDRSDGPTGAHAIPTNPATYHDAGVRRVMNQIVGNKITAALPGEDCGRRPIQLADVVQPIVRDLVFAVYILRARAIAGH